MASLYAQFLQSPNPSQLAADASLAYITTTTEIKESAAILKHLQAQAKLIEKKDEKVLNTIESQNGLALETETTIQFKMGGGAYLPGMDENLLDECVVTFPMTHIVTLDAEQKIKSVRLYWDQGTMLKQVEAIGKTGRNWPIRDGKAQIDAISKSIKSAGQTSSTADANGKPKGPHDVIINQHKKRESVSATRDPHASLSLFAPRDPNESASAYSGPTFAPRQSAKPVARNFVDIAGDEPEVNPASNVRSPSPTKFKSGAGKNYQANRIFDDGTTDHSSRSPERRKKTYDQKYQHFDFGDGEDAPEPNRPTSKRGNHNQAQFSFEDFSTPPKASDKTRKDYERHWGAGVDEDDPPSPAKRPVVHASRPDSEPQFKIADEYTPDQKQKSSHNHRRGDEFDAHYTMGSESPAAGGKENALPNPSKSGKVRSDLEWHWGFGTPAPEKKIYKTAGDGMGGRRDGARSWGIGDESDPEVDADVRSTARSRSGRTATQAQAGAADF
ncbi:hypothetical protein KC357_g5047 [Hortaea werneckii]|nr:hypothetical protein KC357_g5047 [Hortaea werneckii]